MATHEHSVAGSHSRTRSSAASVSGVRHGDGERRADNVDAGRRRRLDDDGGPRIGRRVPRRAGNDHRRREDVHGRRHAVTTGCSTSLPTARRPDADEVKRLAAKGYAAMTAEEKAAWDAGLKGAYNASDLNRVGSAVGYVAGRLTDAGYGIDVSPHVGWTEGGIPRRRGGGRVSRLRRGRARGAAGALPGLPALPEDMDRLTFAEANRLRAGALERQRRARPHPCGGVLCGRALCKRCLSGLQAVQPKQKG